MSEELNPHQKRRRALLAAGLGSLMAGEVPHAEIEEARRIARATGEFSEREAATEQLQRYGVTDFQRRAFKGPISEALARGVDPTYGIPSARVSDILVVLGDSLSGTVADRNTPRLQELQEVYERAPIDGIPPNDKRTQANAIAEFKGSWDAWRMYLGMPQQFGTFEISHFRPQSSTDDRYYYKLSSEALCSILVNMYDDDDSVSPETKVVREYLARVEDDFNLLSDKDASRSLDDDPNRAYQENLIFGIYLVSKGEDALGHYVSYYDRWDFSTTGGWQSIGQPFEIYNRIYYDPETLEAFDPQPTP